MWCELFVHGDPIEFYEGREALVAWDGDFTLNQRKSVFNELIVEADAIFIDPCCGKVFYSVGNFIEIGKPRFNGIGFSIAAKQSDHFVGFAASSGFDGGLADEKCFVGIGLGCAEFSTALSMSETARAYFDACDVLIEDALDVVPGAAELAMSKAISRRTCGDIIPIGIYETFAHDDDAVFFVFEDGGDVFEQLVRFKSNLG